ncbi:MAG: bifunctional ornithine acetyltransferase/N-acetylglutamate synthase [Methanosarcinales archaeon]|nr:bifunctional ornithine acetyltransferase/N-acetylglutamate synthase [ANME-2 cluster archaeon]MDF1531956.1 bifunctional ornithine acetyltransferase/N-acetylglutamate synthase [ANME-2 cluster archaeon]MDW7775444.1 bifunctional ornithine acetyltransferase/N-acetylglutamate synthase [Methanosarcinales archaeon]
MNKIEGGICAVKGVSAWGVKQGKYGLALISAKGNAAGVFTRNRIIAAPLIVTRQHLEDGKLSAVIVNSGNANAFTGLDGIKDARSMAALAAEKLGIDEKSVGVASTGIIGHRLDMDIILSQLNQVEKGLTNSYEGSEQSARAIMTTDTFKKEVAVELSDGIHIGGIAKGSGMIEPNMGTMLAFIYTDAIMDPATLKKCLQSAVDKSFNMVVVDGDTSTNDMTLITATGQSGTPDPDKFQAGLDNVCITLARMIAMDGEGATRLIESRVKGAASHSDAVRAAKAIVRSPLVKSAIFGCDPNWGRVVAAVGYSGAQVEPDLISLAFAGQNISVELVHGGKVMEVPSGILKEIMNSEEVIINVDLGLGSESAKAWGCDLSYDYVRINAEYTT